MATKQAKLKMVNLILRGRGGLLRIAVPGAAPLRPAFLSPVAMPPSVTLAGVESQPGAILVRWTATEYVQASVACALVMP